MATGNGGRRSTAGRGQQQKKSYHHGDLRRALLDAALELVTEEGVAPLTLRAVARRAGVSHAAPYHHFTDTLALLAAVAEEGFVSLAAEMLSAAQSAGADPSERFRAAGIAYVRFAVGSPGHFRVMFLPEFAAQPERFPGLGEAGQAAFQLLVDGVASIRDTRGAGADEAEIRKLLALTAWSLVHGLATLWIEGPLRNLEDVGSIERIAEQITGLLGRIFE